MQNAQKKSSRLGHNSSPHRRRSVEKNSRLAGLKRGEPDLLHGGPPCQPFSKSASWINGGVKRLKDPRAKTLHEYMRVLEDTLPRVFLLENVFGLAYKGKDEGLSFLRKRIDQINKKHKTRYSFCGT